jgi:hypothetical protein
MLLYKATVSKSDPVPQDIRLTGAYGMSSFRLNYWLTYLANLSMSNRKCADHSSEPICPLKYSASTPFLESSGTRRAMGR